MAKVNAVLGSIATDELGVTLIHEHLIVGITGWKNDALAVPYDRKEIGRSCAKLLEEAKAYGVKTLIDATPIDLGRDVELAKEVSEKTSINILVATGLINEALGGASAYLRSRCSFSVPSEVSEITTQTYESFMKEITQGIGDTGVKASLIKVATGHGAISAYEQMVLRAAARAQKETGVPIITHTEWGTMGPEQADLLISEGADPRKVMIGHMCGNANLKYHTSVLEKGVYIGFDRLGGQELFIPDTLRKASLIGLLGIGYANRIMLSQDCTPIFLGRPTFVSGYNPSYTRLFKEIIPALKEAGVNDDHIHTMMVENPRRLFL